MKVAELRELLATAPDDAEVLIVSDRDGNHVNALSEVYLWEKAFGPHEDGWDLIHPDDLDSYDGDELTDAVALWP